MAVFKSQRARDRLRGRGEGLLHHRWSTRGRPTPRTSRWIDLPSALDMTYLRSTRTSPACYDARRACPAGRCSAATPRAAIPAEARAGRDLGVRDLDEGGRRTRLPGTIQPLNAIQVDGRRGRARCDPDGRPLDDGDNGAFSRNRIEGEGGSSDPEVRQARRPGPRRRDPHLHGDRRQLRAQLRHERGDQGRAAVQLLSST